MLTIFTYIPEGFWFFSLAVLITAIIKDKRRFRISFFLLFHLFSFFFLLVKYASKTYIGGILLALSFLFWTWMILVVPFLLIFNGFHVIRKEGRHLANVLSLGFGCALLAGIYAFFKTLLAIRSGDAGHYVILLWLAFGTMMFYIAVIFAAFLLYSIFHHWIPRRTTFDFILVLGAGLIDGERVTPLLASRCNKAIKVYHKSYSACKIICSGGQGADEKISEAQAMKNYLIEQGIPENDILCEDQSATTKENLMNCKAILDRRKGRKQVAVVTSNFHVLRAVIYAREIHLPCDGIGSRTAFYYWPTAMIREFIALMKYYLPWFSGGLLLIWFIEAMLIKFL